jgi:predicted nucleic acid-binding protein
MSDRPLLSNSIVVNASPIIALVKSNMEHVLPRLFQKIVIPDAVWQEICVYKDSAWQKLLKERWIKRESVPVDERILMWNLGKGEAGVLSYALERPDFVAAVDDLAARKCCAALQIGHVGTVGILTLAYRFNLIHSLASALEEIQKAGLYIRDDLIAQLLKEP